MANTLYISSVLLAIICSCCYFFFGGSMLVHILLAVSIFGIFFSLQIEEVFLNKNFLPQNIKLHYYATAKK